MEGTGATAPATEKRDYAGQIDQFKLSSKQPKNLRMSLEILLLFIDSASKIMDNTLI